MRVLIQRVKRASVTVEGELISNIGTGLLVLVGICDEDCDEDIEWLTKKISNIRLFDDENGVMNLSVGDIDGEVLVVSQFTLMASTKKGNRPSYIKAAKPDISPVTPPPSAMIQSVLVMLFFARKSYILLRFCEHFDFSPFSNTYFFTVNPYSESDFITFSE